MTQSEFNQMLKEAISQGVFDSESFQSQFTGEQLEAYLTKMVSFQESDVPAYVESAKASADSAEKFKDAATQAADRAEDASVNTPKVQDGNWWVYDQAVGAYVDSGVSAYYKPVRGTDYWTEEDQDAIVNDVLAALPVGTEVSY